MDCEASDVVGLAAEESVVGIGMPLLALDAVGLACGLVVGELACEVVRISDAVGMLGITVGTTILTLSLDKKDATTPPTLDKMLFICLRS